MPSLTLSAFLGAAAFALGQWAWRKLCSGDSVPRRKTIDFVGAPVGGQFTVGDSTLVATNPNTLAENKSK